MKRAVWRAAALRRDRAGNAAILFGLCAVPMIGLVGLGVDYLRGLSYKTRLDAAADSAAIAAITTAQNYYNANVAAQPYGQLKKGATDAGAAQGAKAFAVNAGGAVNTVPTTPVVTVTFDDKRTFNATVTYSGKMNTAFGKLFNTPQFAIGGSAQSSLTMGSYLDFYLLLDTSPSMAIAATAGGISTMVSNTSSQGGCAFACHQTNPAADNLGNPGGIDNYQLARNLNVTLRMDLVVKAAQDLAAYAAKVATQNAATYRMGIWTFDYQLSQVQSLTSNLATVQQSAGNVSMLTVYKNGWRTSSVNDNDQDTSWASTIQTANAYMPTPGLGTNNTGDAPQETLFIVTDGVADESNGGRQIYAMGGSGCTTLKAKGVKIAILYTYYNPLPTNDFYNGHVKPFQSNIGPTLQACASDGLYSVVNTGEDISSALQNLFSKALLQAHLTQ